MTKRLLRAVAIATMSMLWSLPGSGCIPADSVSQTLADFIHGTPPTSPEGFAVD